MASDSSTTSVDEATRRPKDPITVEVARRSLLSGAEQMRVALMRTAFSTTIYEMLDFCCVIYDADINLLAQSSRSMPSWLGTMGFCIESCVAAVGGPEALEPGDVLFSTYGYDIGSHPQDAAIVMPVFLGDDIVGYTASKAHHLDVGGTEVYCSDTTDNFQEGMIFPGVKLVSRGKPVEDIFRIAIANSRMPSNLAGDLNAQMTAGEAGRKSLLRTIERYGLERFGEIKQQIFDYGETIVRKAIAQIPDGEYSASGALDSNGITDDLVPINITITVDGSDIVVDYTDVPPQQAGPINCPLPMTVSTVRYAVMCIAGARESASEGHFRPIQVRTRPGTLFHPLPPAPIFTYSWAGRIAADVCHRALASALPERIPAGSGGDLPCFVWWDAGPGGMDWVAVEEHFAGQGASSRSDGGAPLMHIANNGFRNLAGEVLEARYPIMIEEFALGIDSGGPGEFQGGPGVNASYLMLDDAFATVIVDRAKVPPWGLGGGVDGRPNTWWFVDGSTPDAEPRRGPGRITRMPMPKGSRVIVRAGGGGGYGPPERREPGRVHADIAKGYVSEEAARCHYPHAFGREQAAW
jgi:N-methylhydantoinase B